MLIQFYRRRTGPSRWKSLLAITHKHGEVGSSHPSLSEFKAFALFSYNSTRPLHPAHTENKQKTTKKNSLRALPAALEEPRKVDRINEMGLELWLGRLDALVPKTYLTTLPSGFTA